MYYASCQTSLNAFCRICWSEFLYSNFEGGNLHPIDEVLNWQQIISQRLMETVEVMHKLIAFLYLSKRIGSIDRISRNALNALAHRSSSLPLGNAPRLPRTRILWTKQSMRYRLLKKKTPLNSLVVTSASRSFSQKNWVLQRNMLLTTYF